MEPTKAQLRDALKALRDLRRKYKGERQYSKYRGDAEDTIWYCPLCNFARPMGKEDGPGPSCNCPWNWFEGKACIVGHMLQFEVTDTAANLSRIDRWESEINRRLEAI